ncbi:MAG: AbrB/MazE/SpoVT family DNA-binding domain-containing protein [Proteobacteria bacterium]|jgi:anti-sigma factor RsiW|nr:AbrB/MazE/SpoVT family DNA-binding domain-containing protein [Pseudomonadota bacterium]
MSLQLTVTTKGQVTLRQAVLAHLATKPGQKVEVALLPNGRVELRAAEAAPAIARLRGALHRPGRRPVSLAEMQDAIERGTGE